VVFLAVVFFVVAFFLVVVFFVVVAFFFVVVFFVVVAFFFVVAFFLVAFLDAGFRPISSTSSSLTRHHSVTGWRASRRIASAATAPPTPKMARRSRMTSSFFRERLGLAVAPRGCSGSWLITTVARSRRVVALLVAPDSSGPSA